MPANWTWDQMVEEFRSLGGVADNICMREGSAGRGIFPLDPSQPVAIHAPKNLLFTISDVEFENGDLRVKKSASEVGKREKEFFDTYQKAFSWEARGREDCAGFVNEMETLPASLRDILMKEFGLQFIFQGGETEQMQNRFLKSRTIRSQGRQVIMPVVELINHGVRGSEFQYKEGIGVRGTFADEVLARYTLSDPLGVLGIWGFASPEPTAFSMPMRLPLGDHRLIIHRNFSEKTKIGNVRVPAVKINGNNVVLSHLLIGHEKFPKLPKGIFYHLMQDQGIDQSTAEELFDRIQHFNRTKFLKLRAALDEADGLAATIMRNVAQYQLRAMSFYVGARKL